MSYNFNISEFSKEKTLYDIFKLSYKIPTSWFNQLIVLMTILLLAANCYFTSSFLILDQTRQLVSTTFSFAITILGFLITGYTIFVILAKPDMLLAMMTIEYKDTGMPTLKYYNVVFMKVFINYLLICFFYAFVLLFGQSHGLLSNIVRLISLGECGKSFIIKSGYLLTGSSFVYLLLLLKTFIFNIYATTMIFLRWEYENK